MNGLEAATQVQDGDAWFAEISIPWDQLDLDGPPENASLLLSRNRLAGGEQEVFQFPVSPEGNHRPDFFAPLHLQRE